MVAGRTFYFALALHLSALPVEATCGELVGRLRSFQGGEEALMERLVVAVTELPAEVGWIEGLFPVCRVLQEDNGRFIPALFMEWCLKDI